MRAIVAERSMPERWLEASSIVRVIDGGDRVLCGAGNRPVTTMTAKVAP